MHPCHHIYEDECPRYCSCRFLRSSAICCSAARVVPKLGKLDTNGGWRRRQFRRWEGGALAVHSKHGVRLILLQRIMECDMIKGASYIYPAYLPQTIEQSPVKMALALDLETPDINENFNDYKDGLALEATSDNIDEVNVLKAKMRIKNGTATQEEIAIYRKSNYDESKDRVLPPQQAALL